MDDQKEMLTQAISTQELERRWKEVRTRMREKRVDFLVTQNENEWLGGYVKWFTDIPARNGYPMTVIFPVDDEMTTITCGKPPRQASAWTMRA
jgi:hypothetical protein